MASPEGTHLEPPSPSKVGEFARWMHAQYEQAAAAAGWETQERTRVPFDDLPSTNRQTMFTMARLILERVPPAPLFTPEEINVVRAAAEGLESKSLERIAEKMSAPSEKEES